MKNNIAICTRGHRKNPPVVFIHGFPMTARMWEPQLAALSDDFYCISYDLRGLGGSSSQSIPFTMEHLVDDLIEVADQQEAGRFVACGLSLGGYILLRALERYPERFRGAILCDTKTGADDNAAKLKRAAAIQAIERNGSKEYVTAFVKGIVHPDSVPAMGELFGELADEWAANDPQALIACQLAMMGRTDTSHVLTQLRIPGLLLCGEHDALTPPDIMKKMEESFPGSRLHIILGAGHLAPLEKPSAVNPIFRDFLRNIYSS